MKQKINRQIIVLLVGVFLILALPAVIYQGLVRGGELTLPQMVEMEVVQTAIGVSLALVAILLLIVGRVLETYVDRTVTQPLEQLNEQLWEYLNGENTVVFEQPFDMPQLQQIAGSLERLRELVGEQKQQLTQYEELLEMETEHAEAANAAKHVFLSRISHDIRTPMNGMIGMAAIAELHINDNERVRDALGKIDQSGKQLLAMLDDVLDMSRIETGRADVTEEDFLLSDTIRRAVEQQRTMAQSRRHELQLDMHGLMHDHVSGNPEYVQQIFSNMIENAVKYTPQGGHIRVTVSEQPSDNRFAGCYTFVFADNGIGMTPEDAARVFEPFERVYQDQRAGEIQGAGLGLSFVRHVVQMMNGSITVESEPENGSCFTVKVMLKLQKRAEGAALHVPEKMVRIEDFCSEDYSDKRVLIVEDNDLSREIAGEILRQTGIAMEFAGNGQEAVLRVSEMPEGYFDMIFMDVRMPVMDGYIATRMIRRLDREDVRHVPIVAMTALTLEDDIAAARRAGMDEHIAKPLELDRLKEILMKWL